MRLRFFDRERRGTVDHEGQDWNWVMYSVTGQFDRVDKL